MKLLIAIPALNEGASISSVIEKVRLELPEASIVVVDDGSTDETAQLAKRAGATVISMPFNVGVGSALRVAFKHAVKHGFTHVMQIDADGQHLPTEAKRLLAMAELNTVVVGSRFLDKNNSYKVSGARRLAMILLAKITSGICATKLTDVTSGFRVASGETIGLFAREYPREYLGDTVESLIIAHRAGFQIKEVPVTMKYRELGEPSQNLIKSTWYLIRALLMIFLAIFHKSKTSGPLE